MLRATTAPQRRGRHFGISWGGSTGAAGESAASTISCAQGGIEKAVLCLGIHQESTQKYPSLGCPVLHLWRGQMKAPQVVHAAALGSPHTWQEDTVRARWENGKRATGPHLHLPGRRKRGLWRKKKEEVAPGVDESGRGKGNAPNSVLRRPSPDQRRGRTLDRRVLSHVARDFGGRRCAGRVYNQVLHRLWRMRLDLHSGGDGLF